jgi:hypothetical protein
MSIKVTDQYPAGTVSDEQLKELALQKFKQDDVKQFNFPTEIIDLPSQGKIYPEGSALHSGKIEMKYMTAKEEDILTSANLIKQGVVLDKLFQSLIVSNGNGQPIKYVDLVTGDKNAIMIAARVLGYGKDYEVEVTDPFTGKKQKETIDLTQFDNKPYDGSAQVAPHTNEFEFTLPRSQRVVTFMAMTESKERKVKHQVEELNKANRKLKDETSRELTTRLKTMILSVDGDADSKVISHFVDNELFAVDSKALRNHINEVVPDIDLNWEFISEETGERREMILPMDVTFFWPNS